MTKISIRKAAQVTTLGLFAAASFAMAQDTTVNGWKRVGDSPAPADTNTPQISQSAPAGPTAAPNTYPESNYPQAQPPMAGQQPMGPQQQQYPPVQQPYPPVQQPGPYAPQQAPYAQQGPYTPQQIPPQVTIPAGTYLTVRVNQRISSDKNQVGDAFSATLANPVVAGGIVVAEPGQTIGGRVAQVQKSGHVSGLAKLGVELTDLTLVDGQQAPVKTMFVSRTANSSTGRDAAAIAGTTGLGAAVGAAAGWGRGAAIGAGAGLVVSTIGVLVTRGEPSVIYPEQALTFKLEEPITVSTQQSPQAFRYVQPNEYNAQMAYNPGPGFGYGAPAAYPVTPAPYAYGYPYYGYPYYPYAGFSLFVGGPRFYGPGFYGRGYYGPYGRGGVIVRR